ncbi:WhiB family transcriptional regulator [Rhodococcus opacus]|uniref:WhiB family transcriptional regulator n=1 Tax=Rhodococcus opacus TaxID=37919 RepID=UPI001F547B01|nr:WhiB family transcriptional regulator [Rhodococcus opacus]
MPRPNRRTHWGWQLQAECRDVDPGLFFPRGDEGRGDRIRRERQAKSLCLHCPVCLQCRQHALTTRERYGIWGGTTESDRRTQSRTTAWSPEQRK